MRQAISVVLALAFLAGLVPADARAESPESPFILAAIGVGRVRLVTLDPGGKQQKIEGDLRAIEGDSLLLSLQGGGEIRVRQQDILALEARKHGSRGLGALGVLLGIPAGTIAVALVCLVADKCDERAVLAGAVVGGAVGGVAAGAGHWETVPLVRGSRVALAIRPVPRGGAVGLQVGF